MDAGEKYTAMRELAALREENARLTRERDEARAEAKRYHDALVARHGGEPVALLEELDASRAEVARLEAELGRLQRLILDFEDLHPAESVLLAEARLIRAAMVSVTPSKSKDNL